MKTPTSQLCPLTSNGDGTYSPSLVPCGYRYECAADGSVTMRPELCGLVHDCGGMPLVEWGEGVYAVKNPSRKIAADWNAAIN